MINRRLYFLVIGFIVLFLSIFRKVYPEADATDLKTVIVLIAVVTSLGVNWVIGMIIKSRSGSDENQRPS